MTDRISIYDSKGVLEKSFEKLLIRNSILLDGNFFYTLQDKVVGHVLKAGEKADDTLNRHTRVAGMLVYSF
jgi:hypothetical protein